jgi:hypothetical protein
MHGGNTYERNKLLAPLRLTYRSVDVVDPDGGIFDERLLGQGLGREDGGGAWRARLPLRRMEQDDFLDAPEFVEEPLHRGLAHAACASR